MVIPSLTPETTDIRLATMHKEIARLEAACTEAVAGELTEIKQRLNFLRWKKETISIVYNWKGTRKSI